MKSRTLKIIKVVGIVIIVSITVFFIIFYSSIYWNLHLSFSQLPRKNYEDRVVGDFVVRFYVDDDYCEIKGTSEQGNNKRFLVIPEKIDGVRVEALGVYGPFLIRPGKLYRAEIESDKIEKVYFEAAIKMSSEAFDTHYCPNIQKVMYPGFEENPYCLDRDMYAVYYFRSIYEEFIDPDAIPLAKTPTYPANVSYYYNYANAENDGYYWMDDCEYGSEIEFIPKDPVRTGYTFGGWYKEPECINKWDFNTDTLPNEITEINDKGQETVVYQETILYAKWI